MSFRCSGDAQLRTSASRRRSSCTTCPPRPAGKSRRRLSTRPESGWGAGGSTGCSNAGVAACCCAKPRPGGMNGGLLRRPRARSQRRTSARARARPLERRAGVSVGSLAAPRRGGEALKAGRRAGAGGHDSTPEPGSYPCRQFTRQPSDRVCARRTADPSSASLPRRGGGLGRLRR